MKAQVNLDLNDAALVESIDLADLACLKLLFHRLAVIRLNIGEKMGPANLLIVPENAKGVSILCEVVAVGPGWPHDTCPRCESRSYEPLTVNIGDKVLVTQNSGYDLRLKSTDFTVINEDEILAIVETKK